MKKILKCTPDVLELLKAHGFQWYKDGTTDRVEPEIIDKVLPAVNGFTVVYTKAAAITMSTAKVKFIDLPDNIDKEWIRVHWINVEDERP